MGGAEKLLLAKVKNASGRIGIFCLVKHLVIYLHRKSDWSSQTYITHYASGVKSLTKIDNGFAMASCLPFDTGAFVIWQTTLMWASACWSVEEIDRRDTHVCHFLKFHSACYLEWVDTWMVVERFYLNGWANSNWYPPSLFGLLVDVSCSMVSIKQSKRFIWTYLSQKDIIWINNFLCIMAQKITVKQENFTTGQCHDFGCQADSRQENLSLEDREISRICRFSRKSRNFPAHENFLFYSISIKVLTVKNLCHPL